MATGFTAIVTHSYFYYSTLQQFFNESKSFQAPTERDSIAIKCHELVANDMEHIPHIIMRVHSIIWKIEHFQIFEWVLCPFHLSLNGCPRKADPNPNSGIWTLHTVVCFHRHEESFCGPGARRMTSSVSPLSDLMSNVKDCAIWFAMQE